MTKSEFFGFLCNFENTEKIRVRVTKYRFSENELDLIARHIEKQFKKRKDLATKA